MGFQFSVGTIDKIGDAVEIIGVGNFELQTRGVWNGVLHLQHSSDNGNTWHTKRAFVSENDMNILEHTYSNGGEMRVVAAEWRSGSCKITMQFFEK